MTLPATHQAAESATGVQHPHWQRIMYLSREMLSGARNAEWERVCRLQDERFDLIRRFFAAGPGDGDLEAIRPQVASLLDMDAEVTRLGREARQALGDDLQQLRQGRSARKAYGR